MSTAAMRQSKRQRAAADVTERERFEPVLVKMHAARDDDVDGTSVFDGGFRRRCWGNNNRDDRIVKSLRNRSAMR